MNLKKFFRNLLALMLASAMLLLFAISVGLNDWSFLTLANIIKSVGLNSIISILLIIADSK